MVTRLDACRPLPSPHPVGRERSPGRHAEDRLRRERGLDALGNAEMTIARRSANSRTDPPATGPSIFLPGGALAEPSSSR